jgi:histidinol dehydrogenase
MNIISFPQRSEWKQLLARPVQEMAEIEQKVLPILQKVKLEGDAALKEFALKFIIFKLLKKK